jgi:hypothetical protein
LPAKKLSILNVALDIRPTLSYFVSANDLQQRLSAACLTPKSNREGPMCTAKGLLAVQDNFGYVAECNCGTLHVTVGPMTVSLDSQALRRLHDMLGNAIDRLDSAHEEELAQPKPVLPHFSHLAMRKVMKLKH